MMGRIQTPPDDWTTGAEPLTGLELAASPYSLELLVERCPHSVLIHQDNRLVYANPAALTLLRATDPMQGIGHPVFDFIVPPSDAAIRGWMARAQAGQANPPLEIELRRVDGTTLHAEAAFGPVVWRGEPAMQVLIQDISERKQIEEAKLKATEARLTAELDAMNRLHQLSTRLLAAHDLPSALHEVLDAAIALLGADLGFIQLYDPHKQGLEIVAQQGFQQDFLNRFDLVKRDENLACGRAMKLNQRVILEDVQTDPDFEPYRHMAASAGFRAVQSTPLRAGDGELLGTLTTHFREPHRPSEHKLRLLDLYAHQASNLIQRIKMEQALRQNEERATMILASITDSFMVVDADARFTYLNPAARSMLAEHGINADDLIGKQYLTEALQEAREDESGRGFLRAMRERVPVVVENFYAPFNRWYSIRFFPTTENGLMIVVQDITERKCAEQALRESEARFRALADASPALIWQLDPEGNIAYLNQRYLDVTGLTPEQLQAMGWDPIVHPDDLRECLEIGSQARREHTGLQRRARLKTKDGKWHWFDSHALPWFAPNGEYRGHVGISIDVTEAVQAEEARKDADRRKDEFLATLAHELRNPLAPISNAVHLLRRPDGRRAADRVIEMVGRQVHHIVRLVDDLLDVSRITRDKIELHKTLVPLADIVASAVEISRPVIDQARHQLTVSLPDQPLILNADKVRLAQVLVNLLNNAAKYTNPGGHIWLTVRQEGNDAVVSVRDSGIGIASDQLSQVFELFAQGQRVIGRGQGGLGIGLSMARRLVEMHNGTVTAHSAGVGQGSEFIVRLPLPETAVTGSAHSTAPVATATAPLFGRRVLVVDDNRDAADSLGMMLETEGAVVEIAYDGRTALAKLDMVRPHAVLLDIGMPDMDGYQVAQRIREQPQFNDVQLIAVTGWGQEADRRQTQVCGINHHLTKPVDYRALKALLVAS